jgi:hypothetical protein
MPEKDQVAAAKEQLAKQNEERRKAIEEAAKRMESGKPTPTQEENDLARLGVGFETHEDDGSGPEVKMVMTRAVEPAAKPAAQTYQTRQAQPAKPASSS